MGELKIENLQVWFYEYNGERKGPVSEQGILKLLAAKHLNTNSLVWKEGFANWVNLKDTELSVHINLKIPPPLTGDRVDNTFAWILAFTPIVGAIIEYFVASIIWGEKYESKVHTLWYITLGLNVFLCYMDEERLSKAGHEIKGLSLWIWLVPVYLFKRSKQLAHNYSYFIVWTLTFGFIVFQASNPTSFQLPFLESKDIQLVKTGNLLLCPQKTVEETVNGFFGNPKWESGVSDSGQRFVNIEGEMTFKDVPVKGLLQFKIDPSGKTFDYSAFEINGTPQNNLITMVLLNKMCGTME